MIDLMLIELMIQKIGISAYIRLKKQLANPIADSKSAFQALNNIDFKVTIALKIAEALENISWWTQRCTIAWVLVHIDTEDRASR